MKKPLYLSHVSYLSVSQMTMYMFCFSQSQSYYTFLFQDRFITRFLTIVTQWIQHTNAAGTAYPSRALKFTPGYSWINVARSLVFCVLFFFCPLPLALHCQSFFNSWFSTASLVSAYFSDHLCHPMKMALERLEVFFFNIILNCFTCYEQFN